MIVIQRGYRVARRRHPAGLTLVELLLVAAFLGVAFLALALALLLDLVAPKTADQPSAYFSFVPTRVIVTVITSMKH